MLDDDSGRCLRFRPDHNGECLNCDAWYDEHVRQPLDPVLQNEYRYWREIFQWMDRFGEAFGMRMARQLIEFLLKVR